MTFSLIIKVKLSEWEQNVPIPIFLDDSVNTIKRKVSLIQSAETLLFIPFIRLDLEIKSGETNRLVKLTNESPVHVLDGLKQKLDPFSTELSIVVTTLLDDLESQNYQEIWMETDKRNMVFYENFLNNYPQLREDTFQMALKIVLFKSNPQIYDHFQNDITSAMGYILTEMNKSAAEITKVFSNLNDYLRSASQVTYSSPRPEEFTITNINYRGSLGIPIDIVDVFNTFKLTETIPFIGIGGQFIDRTNPVVRVFKINGKRVIPEKEIKDFYVTENKKQNLIVYKKVKGIVFKIKVPETSAYLTLLIEPNGTFWINLKPNKTQNVVDNLLNDYITSLLKSVSKDAGVIEPQFELLNISTNIETPFYINLKTFVASLKRPSISKLLFELKPSKSTELTSFLYKKEITINLKDNVYLLNSSVLGILGVSGIWQLCTIYTQIMIVDNLIVSEASSSQLERQQIRERSNIKRLKELGVKVKSTNCQKQRQPIIVDTNVPTVLKHPESYTLDYLGKTYMCTSDEHPFPGFTNENILCCFKKDQRKKEAFIRNTTPQNLVSAEASSSLRKQHVITTEKLLQNNRFGVLPNGLQESINDILQIKNIFRYGVVQDQFSFFNALAKITGNETGTETWNSFVSFVKENKETIEQLYTNIPVESKTPVIENNNLLIISFFTKLNYFIFEEDRLECSMQIITDFNNKYVVLLKKDIHWELIVEKSSNDVPIMTFNRDHPLIKFMEQYYNYSCEKKDYYPESFKKQYSPLPQLNDILGKFAPIDYQIVNLENNKVNFVWLNGGFVPVKESTPKFGIPWKWISEVNFPKLKDQISVLEKVGQNPLGVVKKKGTVVGVVSNTGVMCPVDSSDSDSDSDSEQSSLKEVSSFMGPYILSTERITWSHKKEESTYQKLRLAFARYLNRVDTDLRDTILQVVTSPSISDKRIKLADLIPEGFKTEYSQLDISDLITELIVENTSSDIVNNMVSSKFADLVSTLNEDILYDTI